MALCLGSREAQLPQLSTLALALKSDGPPSFLAVPGHHAPQLTTVWDPELCTQFITLIESTQTQPLLTSLSVLLSRQLSPLLPPHMPVLLLCRCAFSLSLFTNTAFLFLLWTPFINVPFLYLCCTAPFSQLLENTRILFPIFVFLFCFFPLC